MPFALLSFLVACGHPDVAVTTMVDEDSACDSSAERLPDDFAEGLEPEGCRYTVTAIDRDGYVQLHLDVPAFATVAAGEPVSVTYTLPDEAVRLEVESGCGLGGECAEDGASEGFVMRTATATAGVVAVDATPDGEEADAVVTFTDVALVDDYGETALLDASWEVRLYGLE